MNTNRMAIRSHHRLVSVVTFAVLTMVAATRASADTLLLADSFDRADDQNLDTTTNGMSGLLITSGALPTNGVWVEPTDAFKVNDLNTQVSQNQLRIGGQGNTVEIFPNFNFANLISSGTISISLDLKSNPTGTTTATTAERYIGIAVGFGLAEASSGSVDRQLNKAGDLFVDESIDGQIRIYDTPTRVVNTPDLSVDLDPVGTTFIQRTLRVDLTVTNTAVGSTVTYNVLFDGTNVVTGRSFVWSGNNEFYVGLEDRSVAAITNDNFTITAIGSFTSPPVSDLVWRASNNNNWDTSSINWVDAGLGLGSYAFFSGANVMFNDVTGNTSVNVPGAVSPGNVFLSGINSNYTFSGAGSIGGTGSMFKAGSGSVVMNLNNSFSGGTTVSAGALKAGANGALGTGLISLSGGTLSSISSTPRTFTNSVRITIASTLGDAVDNGKITFTNLMDFNGAARSITVNSDVVFAGGATNGSIGSKLGPATLILKGQVDLLAASDVVVGTMMIDGGALTNTDRVIPDASSNNLARLVITNGGSVVVSALNNNLRVGRAGAPSGTNIVDLAGAYRTDAATSPNGYAFLYNGCAYAELNILPGAELVTRGVQSSGNTNGNTRLNLNGGFLRAREDNPFFIQSLSNATVQVNGAFIDDSGFLIGIPQNLLDGGGGLTKIGSGTLLLNGVNTYSGATLISQGTLGGNGTISGPVNMASGSTLAPGFTTTIGTLTIANNLALSNSCNVSIEVNKDDLSKDFVTGLNNVVYAGALTVNNIGVAQLSGGETFQLFSASGTKSGNFSSITILPPTGVTGTFNPATGVLTINSNSSVPTTPTNITFTVSSGNISLSWPSSYLGWSLQVQTNGLNVGLSTNWFTVPGSASVTSTNFPISKANGAVFYRLTYQLP